MRGALGSISSKLILCSLAIAVAAFTACSDDEGALTGPKVVIAGSHSVETGGTLTLSASTMNGQDTTYTWASSDATIATVDSSGTVTPVSAGEVLISATGDQTGATTTHAVVVISTSGGEAAVTVSASSASVVVNSTLKLTAATINATDSSYTWVSSDVDVATVASDGTVTGVSPGEVTITATGDTSQASGTITLRVVAVIPNFDKWLGSAHADKKAEPFNHWNEDDPPEVPTSCARCHSTPGYRDYIGADGSAVEVVDNAAPIGTVIECAACHNDAAAKLDFVTFPSGVKITGLGPEARCMTCHQGRSSTDAVDSDVIAAAEVDISDIESDTSLSEAEKRAAIRERMDGQVNADVVPQPANTDDNLGFVNIHYYAAGATLNAGRVRGGYQYVGQTYDWRFRHVPGKDTCIGCHDPHSLQVKIDECKTCHTAVQSLGDLKDIRMMASLGTDYDGDGNLTEGIYYELDGLRTKLLTAITKYAVDKGLPAICYGSNYPYFLKDADPAEASGACSGADTARYTDWTPRLLRAAYNYQVSVKDPGNFAHNAKYTIQLLYDSITDLNSAITDEGNKVDMTNAVRNDPGHFNGAGEPARHWDEDEAVSSSCSKCHGGAQGFHFYAVYGVGTVVAEPDNGLDCSTCHKTYVPPVELLRTTSVAQGEEVDPFEPIVDSVTFPSGITITDSGSTSNICSTCHSGREAKTSVDGAIARNSSTQGFINVHYLPAAAIRNGADAQVGYEYDAKTYVGKWTGHIGGDECANCHSPKNTNHSFMIADNMDYCKNCHPTAVLPTDIRSVARTGVDYDGDANTDESLHDEILGLAEKVLAAMNATPAGTVDDPKPCYNGGRYPYFFVDADSSGPDCDVSETTSFRNFLPNHADLLKASFNYQLTLKEPGAWAHNFDYIHELLYDSLEDLLGTTPKADDGVTDLPAPVRPAP